MDAGEIYEQHAESMVLINLYKKIGETDTSSGRQPLRSLAPSTGFVIHNRLVTCSHCVPFADGDVVQWVFYNHPDEPVNASLPDPGWLPLSRVGGSDESSYDYAIFAPTAPFRASSLEFDDEMPRVGEPVCTMGFPLEARDLTLSQGYISAIYKSGVARMLKLDMSVNPANSGGPLISLRTGKVIGVVARKETGLTRRIDQMAEVLRQTIPQLASKPRIVSYGGFDPIGNGFIPVFAQLEVTLQELKRSANVGIGFAIHADPLRDEATFEGA